MSVIAFISANSDAPAMSSRLTGNIHFRSVDGNRVEHVPAPVEGEVGFVALYDVFNFEFHPKSPEQIMVSVRLLAKHRAH
jgi:hypothetical protein